MKKGEQRMKLRVGEGMTLDGVMEGLNEWVFPYISQEATDDIMADIRKTGAFLFGRTTYEGMIPWSTRTGEMADIFNTLPKYVVSSTLTDVSVWNNVHIISEHIVEEVAKLKQQGESEKLLLINGSADLVGLLAAHDLIDEYLLTVAPLVVGKGKRLFPEGFEARLRLVEYKAYKTGMLRLHYETVKQGKSV